MGSQEEQGPYFINPDHAPEIVQMEGLKTKILTDLHGERMMMALNPPSPGHTVPTHSHPHEQVGMVHSGRAILHIGGREVAPGDFSRIPANVPHSDQALGDEPFIMLDVFCPIKEDLLAKCESTGYASTSRSHTQP